MELGRKIFLDRRLSLHGKTACADCHVPEQGFTVNERRVCIGANGRDQRRNSPTLLNVAYFEKLYHDGRDSSLESQVWGPLLGEDEMHNPSIGHLVEQIKRVAEYQGQFEAAFAGRSPSMQTVSQSLAAYERSLVSGNSRFDRWRYGGDSGVMNAFERRGFELFTGKAGCSECHTVGASHALFTDQRFHNTGIGWARSMQQGEMKLGIPPVPGGKMVRTATRSVSEPRAADEGRFEVTRDPADRWAYRTPSLRNVAVTAPYMHDGSIATLREVVEFYDRGGIDNPGKDPSLRPLGLTRGEKSALVSFLNTLTGDNVAALAHAARGNSVPLVPSRGHRPREPEKGG